MRKKNRTIRKRKAKKKAKVLVSGCFDLLHSGHIQFFCEAAKYGALYVRLGSDANILDLKNHTTLYPEQERLFMVKSLACVHNAAISTGFGVYDFESDMKLLKPDFYFVNEDASKMPGRVKICERLGVKMIVHPRIPSAGLNERSSTSIKAALRDLVLHEDVSRQAAGVEAFRQEIPWRFCFAGGWMDLQWCNELYPGCVITINFKYQKGICKDQCGLATSSRKHAIKLWNGRIPNYISAVQAVKYLWGAENFNHFGNEETPYIAGSQDHCGLLFPGINKLCYDGLHVPVGHINLNDTSDPEQKQVFAWLEDHLYILEIPFVSRPGDYNSQRINNLKDPAVPRESKVAMAKALSEASERAWQGIISMNSDMLGQGLSDTMRAWETMLPYTVDPFRDNPDGSYDGDKEQSRKLREWWTQYDRPHTQGCLFSGAGGGFLMVISDTPIEGAMKIQLNHDHSCLPFPSDNLNSEPHPLTE